MDKNLASWVLINIRDKARGFTFVEVLASMLFVAILIPVLLEGLRLSSTNLAIIERRTMAARVAANLLNSIALGEGGVGYSFSGRFSQELSQFRWQIESTPWVDSSCNLVTVYVYYPSRGKEEYIAISTLIPTFTSQQTTSTSSTGSTSR